MATSSVNVIPVAGRSFVELTSWAGSFAFATTPVAGMQIEHPDALTVNADGSHAGADGTYTVRLLQPNGSIEAISHVQGVGDTTAPVLSVPTAAATDWNRATASVSTDEDNGTLYVFASTNAVESDATIKASGQPQAVTASGTQNVVITGLSASTQYYVHFYHEDTAGNGSNVVTSTAITTDEYVAFNTIDYSVPAGMALATLANGFDQYIFREWASDPANPSDPGYPVVGDQIVYDPANFTLTDLAALSAETEAVFDAVFIDSTTGQMTGITLDTTGVPAFDANFPKGLVTVDSATITKSTALIEFSYDGTDATGFEYSVDGTWISTSSPINLSNLDPGTPYSVGIRPVNDNGPGEPVQVDFTTDPAADDVPNAFGFTALTNQARNIRVTSEPMTVLGVDAGLDVPVSITEGEYSVSTDGGLNYGGWTTAPTNVRLNYRIRVRHYTSAEYSSGPYDGVRETVLNLNGVTGTFRSTTLADTTAPVISLTGGNLSWTQGTPWVEPGYSAIDNADGDISVSGVEIIGAPDVNTLGPQQILYRATDASGNVAESTRTVTIVEATPTDQTAPVITLSGGNQTRTVGETWSEPGFSASDNVDGDLTDQVVVTGTVNTNVPGTYTLTYSVTDAAGNTSTATRTVTVLPAVQYPLDALAPDHRTFKADRPHRPELGTRTFVIQAGEILDFDFDLTTWLTNQGGDSIAQGSQEITETADMLEVLASGQIPGTDRIKVWLKATGGNANDSYPVQLKVTTTGYRTAVFQIRMIIINRMQ